MTLKCVAFDCFQTVFNMENISRLEIKDYVDHVNLGVFTKFKFPDSWYNLKSHPDSAEGIKRIRDLGYTCVTLSNGDFDLITKISQDNNIYWDIIIDLTKYEVYKPNIDAYRVVEKETGFKPEETLMVTANPTFGDIEGSESIGMEHQVIRNGYPNTIIDLARILEEDLESQQPEE